MSLIIKFKHKKALLLLVFLGLACKQEPKQKSDFEFNQAMHYTISIEDSTLFDLASQDKLTDYEQLKIEVLLNNTPERLSDTLFIKELETIGFNKTQLNTEQVCQLQNLFSIENANTNRVNECINIYRDILVLKQDKQLIGIAKVCVECEAMQLITTEQHPLHLSSENYERLKDLMMK